MNPITMVFDENGCGWSEQPGTIEDVLEELRDDGRIEIESDEQFTNHRVVQVQMENESFTLVQRTL